MADDDTHSARSRGLAALALGALLLLGACASDGPQATITFRADPVASPPSTSSAPVADRPSPALLAAGEIQVVSLGDKPRRELRVTPQIGTQRVEITTTSRITVSSAGVREAATSPTLTQTVEVSVAERGDGRFDVRQEVVDVEVGSDGSPGSRATAASTAEAMVGMVTTGVLDDRGQMTDLDIDLPDDAPQLVTMVLDQMKTTLGQMATPVPEAAIGVGGSWTTTQPIDLLGATATTTTTFTVASLDESGYTVRSVIRMASLPDQAISVSGQTGTLVALSGSGSGVATVRPGQLVADTRGRSRTRQTLEVDGQTLEQEVRTTVRARPVD